MTQEEKAKRYDEAINRAEELLYVSDKDSLQYHNVCHIFPELKEDEDKRIRKIIYGWINTQPSSFFDLNRLSKEEMLVWLEKQGEQKLNGTFVNVDDIREDFIDEVYRVLDADPTNDRANQIIDAFDNLPTITIKQDPCEHCKMTQLNCYSFPCDEKREFEQGKTALEAIKEEKVDNSNRVEPKDYNSIDPHFAKHAAWSEEDERNLNSILSCIEHCKNEDTEAQYNGNHYVEPKHYEPLSDWLKSLKDRYTWKPTWEQLDALEYHLKHTNENSRLYKETKKLYDQLKRL